MKRIKIKRMYIENIRNRETYKEYIFWAKIKVGFKTKTYRFVTMPKDIVCAYLGDGFTSEVPTDREIRETILIKVYGKLMETLAEIKMEETLISIHNKAEEERKQKEREEEQKRIALGEQISIEKYLLNL